MDTSNWIAFGAMVIAIAGLGTAIYSGWLTRRHNRLSVKPHLQIESDFSIFDDIGVRLRNVGTGPAEITKIRSTFDGREAPLDECMKQLLTTWAIEHTEHSYSWLAPGVRIVEKETIWLLRISKGSANVTLRNQVKEALLNVQIEISYESIYGEKSICHGMST